MADTTERLEDEFYKLVREFSSLQEFKKFARSKKGLCLDEYIVQDIGDDRYRPEEQKIQLLKRWREKEGQNATVKDIQMIVQRYKNSRDGSSEGVLDLQDSIRVFTKKKINKQDFIYYGEQTFMMGKQIKQRKLAVKRLEDDDKSHNEASILLNLAHHQNVVNFISMDWSTQSQMNFIFLSMELCHDKNLHDYILEKKKKGESFKHALLLQQARQVIDGLDYIHSKGIAHCDLKPHNILLAYDNPEILKIADFGLSKQLEKGRSTTKTSTRRAGTDGYRAPETYNSNVLSTKGDIFSLGLVIFYIWSEGEHPYGSDPDSWNYNIKNGKGCNLNQLKIPNSQKAVHFLKQLLEFDPKVRPTTKQILEDWKFSATVKIEEGDVWHEVTEDETADEKAAPGPRRKVRRLHTKRPCDTQCIVLFNKSEGCLQALVPTAKAKGCKDTENFQELKTQTILTSMLTQTYSAVAIEHTIYVLMWRKFVYKMDPLFEDQWWTSVKSMKYGHGKRPAAAVLGGHIYVCGGGWSSTGRCYMGGWEFKFASSTCERYDPVTNSWSDIDEMKVERRENTVVAAKGCIYSIGGRNESSYTLSSVEKYIPKTGRWCEVAPLNTPRAMATAAEFKDKIYVLGGQWCSDVEVYDLRQNIWTELGCEKVVRSWSLACVIRGNLYAVGSNESYSNSIYKLSTKDDEWYEKHSLKTIEIEPAASVVLGC